MEPSTPSFNNDLVTSILSFLDVANNRPADLPLLDSLVGAYTRSVPWESAFRIAKKARVMDDPDLGELVDSVRWPAEFWNDAINRGGGGTCFESNYAFFTLLKALGYKGYLTINNMGDSIGCHTAIVLNINGCRWIADVGLPLYVPLLLDPAQETERDSLFHHYTVRPGGGGTYQIDRDRHPKSNCFTLVDLPVDDKVYRSATIKDYGPNGHFLDRVIVNMVIDDQVWRFNSDELPLHLECFHNDRRTNYPLKQNNPQVAIAERFGLDQEVVQIALSAVQR
jgi:arylamine N-acetyltransferase